MGRAESNYYLNGIEDDLALFTSVLSTSTIQNIYNSGTGAQICIAVGCAKSVEISDSSVKGLWHLASDFADSSGFGQNGTGTGSPTFSTSSATNYSGSVVLNGSTQYVDVAGTSSASWNLNLANGSVTLGAWVYLGSGIPDTAAILASDNGGGAQKKYTIYYTSSTNSLILDWYDDSLGHHAYSTSWSPANPSRHFVVLRATGGGTTKHYQFYVDGQAQGAEYTSTDSGGNPNHSFDIGYAETGVIWKGNINEAFFIRNALSTTTIQSIYNNGDGALICTTSGCGS